jgi:hypothetical protein
MPKSSGRGPRRPAVDIGQGSDVTWVVFADPEGNEFCLLRRTVQEVMAERADRRLPHLSDLALVGVSAEVTGDPGNRHTAM